MSKLSQSSFWRHECAYARRSSARWRNLSGIWAPESGPRAASESDPGRQRYLGGLARSYEELARQRGELPEQSEPPAMAQRADLAAALRGLGFSQRHIAERLGCSQQLVSRILQGLEVRD
jgi:hypothetical protein